MKKYLFLFIITFIIINGVQAVQIIIYNNYYSEYAGYLTYTFWENAPPRGSITGTPDMVTSTPTVAISSFSIPTSNRYLITPKFSQSISIPAQFWLLTLYLSASSTTVQLNITIYVVSSTGTILATVNNSLVVSGIPSSVTEFDLRIKGSAVTIPVNGYIAIALRRLTGGTVTLYWGSSPTNKYFTNLQFVNVFLQT